MAVPKQAEVSVQPVYKFNLFKHPVTGAFTFMKKQIFILCLLIYGTFSWSQIRVMYNFTPLTEKTDPEFIREDEEIKKLGFHLEIEGNKSRFFIDDQMASDGDSDSTLYRNLALVSYLNGSEFWMDYNSGIQIRKINRKFVSSNLKKPDWQITGESKSIGGYNCFKADYPYEITTMDGKKARRIITAWFAPELPYSNGPASYFGLPGLILELKSDNDGIYKALSIQTSVKIPEIIFPAKTISEDEFDKEMSDSYYLNNPR